MTPAYIGLGSNLDNPESQLRSAVAAIDALPDSRIRRISSVFRSAPVGPGQQPDYLNAVLLLDTALAADALLRALQSIEQAQGRGRGERWGPRTLDLDILLYGDDRIDMPTLAVPHPRMCERDFVLYPLAEISDTSLHLPDGRKLDTLLSQCPRGRLDRTDVRLEEGRHRQHGD